LPASIETDIRNSVYAGKEVTAHEKPVSFFGKSSVGYTVIDPETGAGAYLIGGGENGGEIDFSVIIDFIGSFLSDLPNELASHFGKMISRVKQVFDFSVDAKDCGLGFAAIKLAAVMAMTIGLA